MASLRISQNRKDDALRSLTHGYKLWAHIGNPPSSSSLSRHCSKVVSRSLSDLCPLLVACTEEDEAKPEYEFRTNTAKLFLELGQHETARQILEVLVDEHDAIAEVWYLLHVALLPDPANIELATEAITQAKDLIDEELENADHPELSELQERINNALATLPALPEGDAVDEDDNEEAEDGEDDDDDDDDGEDGGDMTEGY
jgi:hypothetical protein